MIGEYRLKYPYGVLQPVDYKKSREQILCTQVHNLLNQQLRTRL